MPAVTIITATQDQAGTISGSVDAKGNPAELDGDPTFTSSDESRVTVTSSGASFSLHAVGPVTPAGSTVSIAVDGDGKQGPEVFPIHDTIEVTVIAGNAVSFGISLDTPTEQ